MITNNRLLRSVVFVTAMTTLVLSTSGKTAAHGKWKESPVGTWFCTVVNDVIPVENLLLTVNAERTLTVTSHLSFMGLSQQAGFFLPSGHGAWKSRGHGRVTTTAYFFAAAAVDAFQTLPPLPPPPGLLYVTVVVPCDMTLHGFTMDGDCNVKIYAPVDEDGDGIPNSPYPPTAEPLFSAPSNLSCKRLPVMKP